MLISSLIARYAQAHAPACVCLACWLAMVGQGCGTEEAATMYHACSVHDCLCGQ